MAGVVAGVVLEVAVADPRDVPGAVEGGADRLHVAVPGPTCALSPEPHLVSAVGRESDLPMFVLLRLNDSWSTTGGEFARMIGLAEDYLACGATGVAFGFLDADLEVDTETCSMLLAKIPHVPWTFTRAIDSSLDPRRSWRRLRDLPRLVAVHSAGSPQGMSVGYDDLLASVTPEIAPLLMPGGGLSASSTSAARSAPAARRRRTSTPPTCGRGGRSWTTRGRARPDDPDRPAERAGSRPPVVPPGQ